MQAAFLSHRPTSTQQSRTSARQPTFRECSRSYLKRFQLAGRALDGMPPGFSLITYIYLEDPVTGTRVVLTPLCTKRLHSVGRRYTGADDTWEAVVLVVREKGSIDTRSVANDSGRSEKTVKEWDILDVTQ